MAEADSGWQVLAEWLIPVRRVTAGQSQKKGKRQEFGCQIVLWVASPSPASVDEPPNPHLSGPLRHCTRLDWPSAMSLIASFSGERG
jgi:hypothetical protein